MTSFVDTHCHIDLDAFEEDRGAVLRRMCAAGVHAALVIAYNPERWATSAALCACHACLRRVVGLHPNDAQRWSGELRELLQAELTAGDALAVGETGLDYYRNHATPAQQQAAFVAQIEMARDLDMPIVIHQRNAERAVLDVLGQYAPLRGVMHCFSGDADFASACTALGLHLGIGGVVTYPKSAGIRDALRVADRDRIVLETDAPFLAPQRVRGQRNEPVFVIDVAECLSEMWEVPVDDIARITTENAIGLFGLRLETARRSGAEVDACG